MCSGGGGGGGGGGGSMFIVALGFHSPTKLHLLWLVEVYGPKDCVHACMHVRLICEFIYKLGDNFNVM